MEARKELNEHRVWVGLIRRRTLCGTVHSESTGDNDLPSRNGTDRTSVSGEDFAGFAADVVAVLADAAARQLNRLRSTGDIVKQLAELPDQ